MKKLIATLLSVCAAAGYMPLPGATTQDPSEIAYNVVFTLDTLTVYNPVQSQCDSDPLITASNRKIDIKRLESGALRWMALSRDMISRWGGQLQYGDTLKLSSGDVEIDGLWILQDTMHKRFNKHGDLLFAASHRSLGRWTDVKVTKRYFYARKDARPGSDS